MNKIKKALEQIENKKQASDALEYLTMLKSEMNGRKLSPDDFNTYEKLGEMEHSLYRYNSLLKAGLTEDAEKEGAKFFSISKSPDGAIVLKGGISNCRYVWQTEKGACEACQALDGKEFETLDEVPERPHPNCKCDIVPILSRNVVVNTGNNEEENNDDNYKICNSLLKLEIMRATLTDAEHEINDCIFSVESDIEEIEAKKAEADEFYEKLKDEWYNFVEEMKQLDVEYPIQEPKGLLKYGLMSLEIKNIPIWIIAFQVMQAYNIFSKYQNLADEVFNDLDICSECQDKWKHANVNYECVKLGLLGEQIAIAMSVVKEIKDLDYKINKQKRDALEMIKDSLEDLKADYFGILQAKNRLQNGVDIEEFKNIFHKKHER